MTVGLGDTDNTTDIYSETESRLATGQRGNLNWDTVDTNFGTKKSITIGQR